MKKLITLCLCAIMALSMAACSQQATDTGATETQTEKKVLNLEGTWISDDEGMVHQAEIKNGVIEIYWVSEDTKALYWAGTYEAPTDDKEPYSWTSANDTEKTSTAMLASSDAEKTFTYEDGVLSYSASAMGVTKTVKLTRQ